MYYTYIIVLDIIQVERRNNMENKKNMDMHIHTNYSDGEHSIWEIVELIQNNNIGTFSITDHDSICSCMEIKKYLPDYLEFYNGVEISSEYQKMGMHILGYDFDITTEIEELVNSIQMNRKKRCLELIDMLASKYEIIIPDEEIQVILNHSVVGRPHIVEALYKLGYGNSNPEIFNRYFKGYTSQTSYRAKLEKVIKIIHQSNGIVVLAHPKEIENRYYIDIDGILPALVSLGIDGIEVYNSIHSEEDANRYLELANQYQLFVSGGSDYHGKFTKPDVELGKVTKDKKMVKELTLVDCLRKRNTTY